MRSAGVRHRWTPRNDPCAIPQLLELRDPADEQVRHGVVHGLSYHDDEAAIAGLIELSRDEDTSVRNWATFGLGRLTDADTPEIRTALLGRLEDSDPEIRGEALVGLAARGDRRAMPALRSEFEGNLQGTWPLEAAAEFRDPTLRPLIESLCRRTDIETRSRFEADFEAALAACGGGDS